MVIPQRRSRSQHKHGRQCCPRHEAEFRYGQGVPILRAQVNLRVTTSFEDAAPTNTLWFSSDTPEADVVDIAAAIKAAYDNLGTELGPAVFQDDHHLRIYDMSDPEPRVPIYDELWDLAFEPGGSALPGQCCIVVSFQGPRVSGEEQRRRRGRTYLGPLRTSVIDAEGVLTSTAINSSISWAQDLLTASLDSTTWEWIVWSRVNDSGTAVTNGWVDNSVDIQRRRQLGATVRQLWEAAP